MPLSENQLHRKSQYELAASHIKAFAAATPSLNAFEVLSLVTYALNLLTEGREWRGQLGGKELALLINFAHISYDFANLDKVEASRTDPEDVA